MRKKKYIFLCFEKINSKVKNKLDIYIVWKIHGKNRFKNGELSTHNFLMED